MEEHYHTILIVRYHDGCKVLPPHEYVARGDEISFRAINTAATIMIPNSKLLTGGQTWVRVEAGKEAVVTIGDPGSGVYPYSVFCDAINDFAVGNSSPDLIVY